VSICLSTNGSFHIVLLTISVILVLSLHWFWASTIHSLLGVFVLPLPPVYFCSPSSICLVFPLIHFPLFYFWCMFTVTVYYYMCRLLSMHLSLILHLYCFSILSHRTLLSFCRPIFVFLFLRYFYCSSRPSLHLLPRLPYVVISFDFFTLVYILSSIYFVFSCLQFISFFASLNTNHSVMWCRSDSFSVIISHFLFHTFTVINQTLNAVFILICFVGFFIHFFLFRSFSVLFFYFSIFQSFRVYDVES
jgi:hypothetical protein